VRILALSTHCRHPVPVGVGSRGWRLHQPRACRRQEPSPRAGASMVLTLLAIRSLCSAGARQPAHQLRQLPRHLEWDPVTGSFTDRTSEGTPPDARCQHNMVFEKSTGKVLLFGGAVADPRSSAASMEQRRQRVWRYLGWDTTRASGATWRLQPRPVPDTTLPWSGIVSAAARSCSADGNPTKRWYCNPQAGRLGMGSKHLDVDRSHEHGQSRARASATAWRTILAAA